MAEPNPSNAPASPKPRSRPGPVRWGIAIVLLGLAAWAGWHAYRVSQQRSVVRYIDDLGGLVTYDFEDTDPENRAARDSGPGFIASLLGNDYTHDIVDVNLSVTDRKSLTDEDLRKVSELSSLRKLSISRGGEITDEGLESLARMPGLQKLTLSRCPKVTNAGLAVLARLPELRELTLVSLPGISDEGLRHTAELTKLEQLTINNCPINGSGWQHLQAKSLNVLDASACQVNDEGLKHLAGAAELEELNLAQNQIRGPGLSHLTGLPKLSKLRLGDNQLDPASAVAALKELTSLELLTLSGTTIGREAGKELSDALPKCDITITGGTYDPEEGTWVYEEEE